MKVLILTSYPVNHSHTKNIWETIDIKIVYHLTSKIYPKNDIIVASINDIDQINEIDIIVCYGHVIQEKFLKKLATLVEMLNSTVPIYAISVEHVDNELVREGYADLFDYIITRNMSDYRKLVTRLGENIVENLPDILCLSFSDQLCEKYLIKFVQR